MIEPRRIWWARPRKLVAHGATRGRGPQPPARAPRGRDRLAAFERRVRTVISTMATRHNLAAYEAAGLRWHHVPVPVTADGGDALERDPRACCGPSCGRRARSRCTATATRTSWRRSAPPTCTSSVASSPATGCARPRTPGSRVTAESCALLGVDYEEVTPTSSASVSAVATG